MLSKNERIPSVSIPYIPANFIKALPRSILYSGVIFLATVTGSIQAAPPTELRIGVAGHAFDHLGDIGNQVEAAAASGGNIIYTTGLGAYGYQGLPAGAELLKARKNALAYTQQAKSHGIRLALGYVCATSIVGLKSFNQHWSAQFRAQFKTPPADWRQQDKDGHPLASWYGGEYQPACMNNPDWRAYEKFMVRLQLESGHEGIFFDNPTVHPQGCYCPCCMEKFAAYLTATTGAFPPADHSVKELRKLAIAQPNEFLQFRSTTARDFLAEMRTYARTINRHALITCNNSLNSADALYSQCRSHGYNINEMSRTEDLVVVEDMSSQPRSMPNGRSIEYGPTYKLLHALSHGKPVVAVTLAEADYHTSPNLVRLAMAEATANEASYLMWPTWPENKRQTMAMAIRPQADLLRSNEKLLNDTQPRCDVLLFLPFRRWIETNICNTSALAATLSRLNIQFMVSSEEDLERILGSRKSKPLVLLIESLSVLTAKEKQLLKTFERDGGRVVAADGIGGLDKLAIQAPSISLQAPETVRAVVRDQRNRTMVHLYNLDVERLSSYEDKVHPAQGIHITLHVPFRRVHSVRALTADRNGTAGQLEFTTKPEANGAILEATVPRLEIETILVVEK